MAAVSASLQPTTVLVLACISVLAAAAGAEPDRSDAERECRAWADSMFREPTAAKSRELARCIAERDPESAEARAAREAARVREVARAEPGESAPAERAESAERDAAEAASRCGGALIVAYGPLHFCDSPQTVVRKAAESGAIECFDDACDRVTFTTDFAPLTAYPKYHAGGLYRLALYTPERARADRAEQARRDWEALVAFAKAEYGPSIVTPSRYPDSFGANGSNVAYTHHWVIERKQVRVGVFEDGRTAAATLVIEDRLQKSRKERGDGTLAK